MPLPLYRCDDALPPQIPGLLAGLNHQVPLEIHQGIVGDDATSFRFEISRGRGCIEISRGRGCIEIYGGQDGRFTTLIVVQVPRNILGWRASRILHEEARAALISNGVIEMTDEELGELSEQVSECEQGAAGQALGLLRDARESGPRPLSQLMGIQAE